MSLIQRFLSRFHAMHPLIRLSNFKQTLSKVKTLCVFLLVKLVQGKGQYAEARLLNYHTHEKMEVLMYVVGPIRPPRQSSKNLDFKSKKFTH